jgi:hypothetical protein
MIVAGSTPITDLISFSSVAGRQTIIASDRYAERIAGLTPATLALEGAHPAGSWRSPAR